MSARPLQPAAAGTRAPRGKSRPRPRQGTRRGRHSSLTLRLDEAVRLVDDLPLLAMVEPRSKAPPATRAVASAASAVSRVRQRHPAPLETGAPAQRSGGATSWPRSERSCERWWRVTRIEHPEAMLVTPEQQFFVRGEPQAAAAQRTPRIAVAPIDIAQSDLRDVQATLDRYFERHSKRATAVSELLRQVAAQARQTSVPRPDDTLAALATAAAGR